MPPHANKAAYANEYRQRQNFPYIHLVQCKYQCGELLNHQFHSLCSTAPRLMNFDVSARSLRAIFVV
jgi:hypothetical protein